MLIREIPRQPAAAVRGATALSLEHETPTALQSLSSIYTGNCVSTIQRTYHRALRSELCSTPEVEGLSTCSCFSAGWGNVYENRLILALKCKDRNRNSAPSLCNIKKGANKSRRGVGLKSTTVIRYKEHCYFNFLSRG